MRPVTDLQRKRGAVPGRHRHGSGRGSADGDRRDLAARPGRGRPTPCCSARPAPARPPRWPGWPSGCSGRSWSCCRTRRSPPSSPTSCARCCPNNAVEYFVSYYDYYQPEAYVPQTDTYIEKDSSINDEVERLRHSATNSLLTRRDTIVVASVSCIYGLGTPQEYVDRMLRLRCGVTIERDMLLRKLVGMQYARNDLAFTRGTFRVRGDTIEIIPVYEELAVRIEMFGDEIERLMTLHPLTGEVISEDDELYVFPATHYVAGPGADGAGDRGDRGGAGRAARRARARGQAARGAAAADADHLRRRDDAPGRQLLGHRELLAAHRRPRGRQPAEHPARLLPRGLPAGHRRVAQHRAADRRDVRG